MPMPLASTLLFLGAKVGTLRTLVEDLPFVYPTVDRYLVSPIIALLELLKLSYL